MREIVLSFLLAAMLILAWSLQGCTVPQQVLDPDVFYRRDMRLEINGVRGDGVLVVPENLVYAIDARLMGAADVFTMSSCHREMVFQEAGQNGFFGDKRRVKTSYIPVLGLEHGQYCPLHLSGLDRGRGRHSWAFVDFQGPGETLPAQVSCNGVAYPSQGVSACQSLQGLDQAITFPTPVVVGSPLGAGCPRLQVGVDAKTIHYRTPRAICVYTIGEAVRGGRLHRLTTIGYDQVPVRGD